MSTLSNFIVILIFFVIAPSAYGQDVGVSIKSIVSVGDSLEAQNDGNILGSVTDAAFAPNGDIYVFDGTGPYMNRYAPSGRYIGTLGRMGRGPGEFMGNGLVAVQGEDTFVFDPKLQRFSLFDSEGTYQRSISVQNGGMYPTGIQVMNDTTIAVVDYNAAAPYIITTVHSRTGESVDEVNEPRTYLENRPGLTNLLGIRSGHIYRYEDLLYYLPSLYSGEVFRYAFRADGWIEKEALVRDEFALPAFEVLDPNEYDRFHPRVKATSFSQRGRLLFDTNRESRGIISSKEGYVLAFYVAQTDPDDQDRDLFVDVFSQNGRLLDTVIPEFNGVPTTNDFHETMYVCDVNGDGHLLIRATDNFDVVYVSTLRVSE